MTADTAAGRARRPYRSARRQKQAEETAALVVAAATTLFAEQGWAGTGMRDIARQAGVSVETVYANFRSKGELLLRAIDVSVVGDTAPVTLSERPEFAALGTGSRGDRIAAAARLLAGINQRTYGLRRALSEAGASDAQLAAKIHELENRRRDNIREGIALVTDRPDDADVLDALWVVMGADAFVLLTQVGRRSLEEYERWLAETIDRLLGDGVT
ncbi:MAG: helix-turn-helix domain-containing protein [Candidatus Nanopelagicales bacterium]